MLRCCPTPGEVVVTSESGAGPFDLVGLVVIGRNEGERLARCLASVRSVPKRVYVDSGSTDGSVPLALSEGAEVIELPVPPHFTAARARNAGMEKLLRDYPDLQFVQVVDGDSEVQSGWVSAACHALRAEPELALVFGRRRERHPEASIYNALCDDEWNVPVGYVSACGGDVMFRVAALRQVGLYDPAMIAGEEPDLAMRLCIRGWKLRRIDEEMTLHDVAITRFSQWWTRARRAGHAFADLAARYPHAHNPNYRRSVLSILAWGAALPALVLASLCMALTVSPTWALMAALLGLLVPVRMLQLGGHERRRGLSQRLARASGCLLIVAKPAQFLGLATYYRNRLLGRSSRLIEYKGPT